jgi:TRAP-type C4-dicarboxylate transport system permease small subunit
MLLTISDVLGRDLFLKPIPGTLEITESLLVFVTFLSLAHVLTYGEHVKITIFVDHLSPKKRVWFDMFALAIGFVLMFLMSWRTLPYAIYSYECKEVADKSFALPLYFAKFALFIGCAMLAIQFLMQLLSHFFGKLFSEIPSDRGKTA